MSEQNLNEITSCEVCGNQTLDEVLNLGEHPMCDDLVEIGDTRQCREFPIVIMFCNNCFTAHQKYQVPKTELFPKSYHYRSRFTNDVLNGMRSLVADCERQFGDLSGKKVLDIGCNDGSLLDFFREKGAKTFGVEPTDAFSDARKKGHTAINDFFTPKSAEKFIELYDKPNFITFTNVFAHIENLTEVIKALKILSGNATVIIIENHYLGAVIEKNQFDTFYHEHPRTYSYNSFTHIAKSLGMRLLNAEFPSRYGGNIRVTIGDDKVYTPTDYDVAEVRKKEVNFFEKLMRMNESIVTWKEEMKHKLADLHNKYGLLPAKAFPGRAAILIKLLDLDNDVISETYEKPGSMKIGHYIPGTRIPVKSDDDLMKNIENIPIIVNFAWHIHSEIENYLKGKGFKGEVINIL